VKLIAMSNSDEFTPNQLQQIYGRNVVDEDVSLEFSDEELESIAGMPKSTGHVKSYDSDLFLEDRGKIMSYNEFSQVMRRSDDHQEIAFIQARFRRYGVNISLQVAGVIWNNLRATAPILIKRAHRGFTVDLNTGQLSYIK
jgi:hypothetical protein